MLTKLLLVVLPFPALSLLAPACHADPLHAVPVHAAAEDTRSVDQLIAQGRALLAEGKAVEAEAVFQTAEKADGSTIKTRMWTLRSWLPQGRVNDTLDAIDKLDRAGAKGPDMDYLYGMAWAFKAKGYIAERAPGSIIDMSFTDAVTNLEKATKADPARFYDAFAMLAESAWYARNLPLARTAADKACEVQPKDPESHLILGQVAMAQFVAANADPAQKPVADKHWDTAFAANTRAVTLLAALGTPAAKARSAAAHVELARAYGWKQKPEDAAREYGLALGFDPGAVDFNEVRGALDGAQFVSALQAGVQNFTATWGAEDKGDALLSWWLGYAQFLQKQYADAEKTFLATLAKRPDFYNSWYYLALARYHQQKYPESIEAFMQNFKADPADLVRSIEQDKENTMFIIGYLGGVCFNKGKHEDGAVLAEIQVAVEPANGQYWNNVGLFYRDAGDVLVKSKKEEERARAPGLWEKALVAYEKSVSLAPDDPNYLNDLAVVLDYNLKRDLPRAKALYEKAIACANAELAKKDLTPDVRELRQMAARDAKNNLDRLVRRMEREAKEKEKEKEKEPEKSEQH
jgi:tetratricopeptide (TPR) repeat protein